MQNILVAHFVRGTGDGKMTDGYRLYRDGNAWCAVAPGFRNLAEDVAGFGDTQEEAVASLHKVKRSTLNITLYEARFEVGGYCRRCKEWVEENIQMDGCCDPDCPCQ